MKIYLFHRCDVETLSKLAETSKTCYELINNGVIWKCLGLGNFVDCQQFRTMRQIFDATPKIAPEVIASTTTKFIETIPSEVELGYILGLMRKAPCLKATTGQWIILLELLKRGADIPENLVSLLEHWARKAHWEGALNIYVVLDRRGLFKRKNYDEWIGVAAQKGAVAILKSMLEQFPHSDARLKMAFAKTAENGHVEAARILKPDGHYWFDLAFRSAEEQGHTEVAKALLPFVSQEAVLENAARHGDIEVVKALLPMVSDSKDSGIALQEAAENGHTELVKFLLNDPLLFHYHTILRFHFGPALERAAKNGHIEVVRILHTYAFFPYGYISADYCQAAREKAKSNNHMAVVEVLDEAPGWFSFTKDTARLTISAILIRNKLIGD